MDSPELTHDDYIVAWICPLEVEQIAAILMLDEQHPRLPQPQTDHNAYMLGSVKGHNVVIAGLPSAGNAPAATVVAQMVSTFPKLRFGLLVGIGGGVPVETDEGPVRLGHVVVSKPTGQHSGAVQYDHGKAEAGVFMRTGVLAPPPHVLLNAAQRLSVARAQAPTDPLTDNIRRINTSRPKLRRYRNPGMENDHLYEPDYVHLDRRASCKKCECDPNRRVRRNTQDSDSEDEANNDDGQWVVVHRGTIAAGERVIKDGVERDRLAKTDNILCFEMEAAGALNDFPCLVIRGISDYADSHKNDKWHGYGAAVAAAFARELFNHLPIDEVTQCKIAQKDVEQMIDDTRFVACSKQEGLIKSWLDPPDASTNHIQARKEHHQDTGVWFLTSERYTQWKAKFCNTLWLHGIPGCGKTILSSTVIENLETSCKASNDVLLYFYFNFNDSKKQSFDSMVRSLVFQLYHIQQTSRSYLEQLHFSCRKGHKQPQHGQLLATLHTMLHNADTTYIVIDALDECRTRKELQSWLASPEAQGLQLFLTSRKEDEIESSVSSWLAPASIVPIRQGPVDNDIRAFIHSKMGEDEELQRWQDAPDVCTEIESKLMEKAGGMFRWAVCQLEALRGCLDLPSLEEALTSLPESLDETYERILSNIPQIHRRYAIRILQFLTFSERPLRLDEAVDAIAVFPNRTPAFDYRHRMPKPREITRYCTSLVTITSRKTERSEEDIQELQLAHFSVKEYLVSDRIGQSFRDVFEEVRARSTIVTVSLSYLLTAAQDQDVSTKLKAYPFSGYCARYWMEHAAVAKEDENLTRECISGFFAVQSAYTYWLSIYDPEDRFGQRRGEPKTIALYYASLGGFTESVKQLLDKGANVNESGGRDGNALQAASARGHEKVVDMLLQKGADVDAQGGEYGNALLAACLRGHEKLVAILLEKGADVNAQGGQYGSALQAACLGSYEKLAAILLDKGANVNAQGGKYGNALHVACQRGYERLAVLLLDKGADVNADARFFNQKRLEIEEHVSALYIAAANGHVGLMVILLEKHADVNAQGGQYGNALQVACQEGYKKVVEMLLEKGANVNAQGGWHGNALQAACLRGHEKLVAILLEKGADVNAQGGEYGSALQAACLEGYKKVAEMLLEKGANANAQGGRYGNALLVACLGGYEKLAVTLLEKGANVNAQGGWYGNALLAACLRGHDKLVAILLEKGADVNAQGGEYGNALQAACLGGHEKVVEMLLQKGADVDSQGGEYGNALLAACLGGHEKVAVMLLERGAYVNALASQHGSALTAACAKGLEKIALMLLEKGANVNAIAGKHGSALYAASQGGTPEIQKLLVQADAKVIIPLGLLDCSNGGGKIFDPFGFRSFPRDQS